MKQSFTKLLLMLFALGIIHSINAQTLNQAANWPNASWIVTGSYTSAGLLKDPAVHSEFSFDDDGAGSGSVDNIQAESPVIDLTAAHGAGETFLQVSGTYVYDVTSDFFGIEYWDNDASSWQAWYTFAGNGTSSTYDDCTNAVAYTSSGLSIAGFTGTQLSNFKYRLAYDDGGGWRWGFCTTSPTITSQAPPCNDPSGQTTASLMATSVDLDWTENGASTTWNIEYGPNGFTRGGGSGTLISGTSTKPYNLSGLTANTAYDWYVQAGCGSAWIGPDGFTTPPVNDDCAGALDYDAAFGVIGANGTCPANTQSLNIAPFTDAGDDPSCDFGGDAAAWYTWTANTTSVVFTSGTGGPGLEILDGSCGSFTSLGCLNNLSGTISGMTIGNTYYMIIWDDGLSGTTIDWCLEMPVSCADPTAQSETNLQSTQVDLEWTENGLSTNWEIEWGPAGFTPTGTATFSTTTNPHTLMGLSPSTAYDWYVRSDCGGGTYSAWVGLSNFTTPAPPPANDACSGAITLSVGGTVTGSTTSATNTHPGAPCSPTGAMICLPNSSTLSLSAGIGVWYKYTSTVAEEITVTTDHAGTSFDTEIQVFEGSCPTPTCVGGDDDEGSGTKSTLCWTSSASPGPNSRASVDYFIYIDGSGATSTGNFEIGLQTVLPADLVAFNGRATDSGNVLTWETASELNTEVYDVEVSYDSRNWKSIGQVASEGNTTDANSYEFVDRNPAGTSYYRLHVKDYDGFTEYSHVIVVERADDVMALRSLYPNPTSSVINLEVNSPQVSNIELRVVDTFGKTMMVQNEVSSKGMNNFRVETQNLSKGIYRLVMISNNKQFTKSFVIQ